MDTSSVADEQPLAEGIDVATAQPIPHVEIEVLDGVHCFIEGKEALPGSRWMIPGTLAINLVGLGHAKITGSEDAEKAQKRWAKGEHDKTYATQKAPD